MVASGTAGAGTAQHACNSVGLRRSVPDRAAGRRVTRRTGRRAGEHAGAGRIRRRTARLALWAARIPARTSSADHAFASARLARGDDLLADLRRFSIFVELCRHASAHGRFEDRPAVALEAFEVLLLTHRETDALQLTATHGMDLENAVRVRGARPIKCGKGVSGTTVAARTSQVRWFLAIVQRARSRVADPMRARGRLHPVGGKRTDLAILGKIALAVRRRLAASQGDARRGRGRTGAARIRADRPAVLRRCARRRWIRARGARAAAGSARWRADLPAGGHHRTGPRCGRRHHLRANDAVRSGFCVRGARFGSIGVRCVACGLPGVDSSAALAVRDFAIRRRLTAGAEPRDHDAAPQGAFHGSHGCHRDLSEDISPAPLGHAREARRRRPNGPQCGQYPGRADRLSSWPTSLISATAAVRVATIRPWGWARRNGGNMRLTGAALRSGVSAAAMARSSVRAGGAHRCSVSLAGANGSNAAT